MGDKSPHASTFTSLKGLSGLQTEPLQITLGKKCSKKPEERDSTFKKLWVASGTTNACQNRSMSESSFIF